MQSEQINELATALSKAQSEIEGAVASENNPYFKSKYADLHSVWQACKPSLTKYGLSVTQTFDYDADKDKTLLITTLMHASGQWIKGRMLLPIVKPGAQEVGSATTYCRRYALSAIIGISTFDDDGEEAMKAIREKPKAEIRPDTSKTRLLKAVCATGTLVSIEELDAFVKHTCTALSKPDKPFTPEQCIATALESEESLSKFSAKLKGWMEKLQK